MLGTFQQVSAGHISAGLRERGCHLICGFCCTLKCFVCSDSHSDYGMLVVEEFYPSLKWIHNPHPWGWGCGDWLPATIQSPA